MLIHVLRECLRALAAVGVIVAWALEFALLVAW